ncbi:hypothetical protein U4E84_03525 [Halorubrum sp. AD140]|uniref:hypothetical protein n=1 Tax=Halorubrum sp. AD140 TaxID=3050073 RepID=UPI002ACCBA4D|nr:hypothetical protein [Halorubrum sp. AD140]MDZ5810422.1 hypothetical protein [Halorubrum sp. AD140]
MSGDSSLSEALRDALAAVSVPEHTGENRCLPCTLVNAVGVAVVAALLSRRRRSLGLLAALLGGAAIWLRGYVLPGTPRFAPRIVAPLPFDIGPDHPDGLDSDSLSSAGGTSTEDDPEPAAADDSASGAEDDSASGAEDDSASGAEDDPASGAGDDPAPAVDSGGVGDGDQTDPEAMMAALLDAGALVEEEETLVLDESFRSATYDRIRELREGPEEDLAERAAAIAGPDVEGQVHDGRILLAGRRDAWLSRPTALAETAAAEVLRERGVDDAVARTVARPLCAFLDTCPACDGPVRETTLRHCCGGPGGVSGNPERPVRACADCDAVVFTDFS